MKILLYPSALEGSSRFIALVESATYAGSTLVAADADSGTIRAIYVDSLEKRLACLSPDGKRVLYLAAPLGMTFSSAHPWVVDVDGKNGRDLAPGTGNWESLSWAPDGRSVVFAGAVEDSGEVHEQIVTADATSGALRLMTRGRCDSYSPAFLADGRRIVYESNRIRTTYGGKVFLLEDGPR